VEEERLTLRKSSGSGGEGAPGAAEELALGEEPAPAEELALGAARRRRSAPHCGGAYPGAGACGGGGSRLERGETMRKKNRSKWYAALRNQWQWVILSKSWKPRPIEAGSQVLWKIHYVKAGAFVKAGWACWSFGWRSTFFTAKAGSKSRTKRTPRRQRLKASPNTSSRPCSCLSTVN